MIGASGAPGGAAGAMEGNEWGVMDDADRATARIEQQQAEGIRRSAAAVAARGKVRCEDCDDVIPLERSRALPSATRCVGCQGAAERAASGR